MIFVYSQSFGSDDGKTNWVQIQEDFVITCGIKKCGNVGVTDKNDNNLN